MDWSYIAGYFDGEGSVANHRMKHRGDLTRGLSWYNTHRKSLEAMMSFMECGRIETRPRRPHQNKPSHRLIVSRKTDLLHAIDGMLPHLIIKKVKVEKLRTYLITNVDEARASNNGKLASVDTKTLRRWYYKEKMSLAAIAERVGVKTASAVTQLMQRRGIKRRPAGGFHMKGVPKSEETRQRMRESWQRRREDA